MALLAGAYNASGVGEEAQCPVLQGRVAQVEKEEASGKRHNAQCCRAGWPQLRSKKPPKGLPLPSSGLVSEAFWAQNIFYEPNVALCGVQTGATYSFQVVLRSWASVSCDLHYGRFMPAHQPVEQLQMV